MTASSSNTGTLDAQLPRHTGNLILLSELLANHQVKGGIMRLMLPSLSCCMINR